MKIDDVFKIKKEVLNTQKKDLRIVDLTEIPKVDTHDNVKQQMEVLPDSQESLSFVASSKTTNTSECVFHTSNFNGISE